MSNYNRPMINNGAYRCPHARARYGQDVDYCELNGNICVMEAGYDCETWNYWLSEICKEENHDLTKQYLV